MDKRVPDQTVIIKCSSEAQKNTRILHIYKAEQWRSKFRVGKRNMYPQPPSRDPEWWFQHFRILIDGCWYSKSKRRYYFITKESLTKLIGEMI